MFENVKNVQKITNSFLALVPPHAFTKVYNCKTRNRTYAQALLRFQVKNSKFKIQNPMSKIQCPISNIQYPLYKTQSENFFIYIITLRTSGYIQYCTTIEGIMESSSSSEKLGLLAKLAHGSENTIITEKQILSAPPMYTGRKTASLVLNNGMYRNKRRNIVNHYRRSASPLPKLFSDSYTNGVKEKINDCIQARTTHIPQRFTDVIVPQYNGYFDLNKPTPTPTPTSKATSLRKDNSLAGILENFETNDEGKKSCNRQSVDFLLNEFDVEPLPKLPKLSKFTDHNIIGNAAFLESRSNGNICAMFQEPSSENSNGADLEIEPCRWKGCKEYFSNPTMLMEHISNHHIGRGKTIYICNWTDCGRLQRPFTKRHKLLNHLRTHTGERPYLCKFPDCGKRFSRPDSLQTHVKTHSGLKPFVCGHNNCGKAYFHARSLRKHELSHLSEKNTIENNEHRNISHDDDTGNFDSSVF